MPADVVVDTSILAKVFFDEADSAVVRSWIGGVSLFAPRYIIVEIASVGLKKVREGVATEAVAVAAYERTPRLIDVLTDDGELLADAFALGAQAAVSLYDGLFVALAMRLGMPLVTADVRCIERLRAANVSVQCLTPQDL